jgi:hypothetical protein
MAKHKTMAYMVDPTMAAAGIQAQAAPISQPQAFSYDVPMQANMMGNARPVFNQQTQGMAQAAFGTPAMRQASVGAAFQMTQAQEDAFGPGGHSENPGLYKNLK